MYIEPCICDKTPTLSHYINLCFLYIISSGRFDMLYYDKEIIHILTHQTHS